MGRYGPNYEDQVYVYELEKEYFKKDEIVYLQSLENGFLYTDIYLKMCVMGMELEGQLLLNVKKPVTLDILPALVNHKKEVVDQAIKLFEELELISWVEMEDSGPIIEMLYL